MTFETSGNAEMATLPTDLGRFCWVFRPCLSRITPQYDLQGPNCPVSHTADNVTWNNNLDATNFVGIQDANALQLVGTGTGSAQGLALRARPVGMSVWAKFIGSDLNNQGSITAALLPADVWGTYLSATNVTAGTHFARWEDLANAPGAFQGAVKDGAYVWWRPQSTADTQLYDLDTGGTTATGTPVMQEVSYPIIIISGQMPPSAIGAYPGLLRFRVCVNYEYVTASRLIPTTPSEVSREAIEVANRILARVPTAMANEEHTSWINTIIKAGIGLFGGFALGGPAGAALGALAGAGVSLL
jgi:hypothetical protein